MRDRRIRRCPHIGVGGRRRGCAYRRTRAEQPGTGGQQERLDREAGDLFDALDAALETGVPPPPVDFGWIGPEVSYVVVTDTGEQVAAARVDHLDAEALASPTWQRAASLLADDEDAGIGISSTCLAGRPLVMFLTLVGLSTFAPVVPCPPRGGVVRHRCVRGGRGRRSRSRRGSSCEGTLTMTDGG